MNEMMMMAMMKVEKMNLLTCKRDNCFYLLALFSASSFFFCIMTKMMNRWTHTFLYKKSKNQISDLHSIKKTRSRNNRFCAHFRSFDSQFPYELLSSIKFLLAWVNENEVVKSWNNLVASCFVLISHNIEQAERVLTRSEFTARDPPKLNNQD